MKASLVVLILMATSVVQAAESFRYCVEGVATQLDPNQVQDVMTENAIAQNVFGRLVDVDLKTGKIVPSLAERWEVSKDGKTYTFFLRKNVKYHERADFKPSRDFNADDVVATFQRLREPPPKVVFGVFESFGLKKLIEKIEKVNDHKIRFDLKKADANFLGALAHPGQSVQGAEFLKAKATNESLLPIGTGPFVMQKFLPDQMIRYTAHPHFWNGTPKIKNLFVLFVPDGNVRTQKLKTGECDFISEVPPVDQKAIEEDKNLELYSRVGFNSGYLGFNTERVKDVRVRRALGHALNVENYLKAIFLGRGVKAQTLVPKEMLGYVDLNATTFDLQKAKKLKTEVKEAFPKKLTILVLPISRAYNPSGKKMAELIQADLKALDVEVELVNYDWTTFIDASRKGGFDMLLIGGNHHTYDPGIFLRAFFGCGGIGGFNATRFCNPEYEAVIQKSQETVAPEKRAQFYREAMKIFARELPAIPIAHGKVARAGRKGIKNYVLGPAGRESFAAVDM